MIKTTTSNEREFYLFPENLGGFRTSATRQIDRHRLEELGLGSNIPLRVIGIEAANHRKVETSVDNICDDTVVLVAPADNLEAHQRVVLRQLFTPQGVITRVQDAFQALTSQAAVA